MDVVRTGLTLLVAAAALLGDVKVARAQDQQPPVATTPSGVSVDHVRDGLRRPELYIPPVQMQEPTFRSGVTEKLETPLDVMRRELQEEARLRPWENGPSKPPGVIAQVDVLPAVYSLVAKIKAIRREHAEADARQMVDEELAEFCSAHDCAGAAQLSLDEGVILPR
jgi:hypothetical protein